MSFTDKVKNALDWFGRGQVVVQILLALGAGTVVRALIHIYTGLNAFWITPVWLLASGFFLALLIMAGNTLNRRFPTQRNAAAMPLIGPEAVTISSLTGAPTRTPIFDVALFFRTSYHSPMTAEVEKNIGIIAKQNSPNNESSFLCRFVGVGLVAYLHDMTWAYIYKSQLLMLQELNHKNGLMPVSEAKAFYDRAAVSDSSLYANYAFSQWIRFMKTQELLIEHPSQMLEITHRGKDFLKYLTHWGADLNTKGH